MSLLRRLFRGATDAPTTTATAPRATLGAAVPDTLRWVEAEESPFGVRFLDCRAVALKRRIVPTDKTVENRWARERANDGRRLRGARPDHAVELTTSLTAPMTAALPPDGPVFKGDRLEEKWDAYLFEGYREGKLLLQRCTSCSWSIVSACKARHLHNSVAMVSGRHASRVESASIVTNTEL